MADTKISALTAAAAAAGANELAINEAGTSKKVTVTQIQTFLAAAGGMSNVYVVTNQHDIASTTPSAVTDLTKVAGVGTWVFQYFIRYRSVSTTNGVRFSVNHTGTVTSFVANMRWVDTSATASTAAADQDAIGAAGQVVGAMSARAKSVAGWGTTIQCDTINVDLLMIVEGLMVVSVSGNIELYHGSEGATTSSVMSGSCLVLTQVG